MKGDESIKEYKGWVITVYDVEQRLRGQLGGKFEQTGFEYEIWREDKQYDSTETVYDEHFNTVDDALRVAMATIDESTEE